MRRAVLAVAVLLSAVAAGPPQASAQHPMEGSSTVIRDQLGASVHRTLGCFSCHGVPEHAPAAGPQAACQNCHRDAAADFGRGSHGLALRRGEPSAPNCVSCHGSHGVMSARAVDALTSAPRQPMTCGRCHRKASEEFAGSTHGRALLATTRSAAPTCSTCHGGHLAASTLSPRSPVNPKGIARTCGTCHVQARLQFGRSVHGSAVARGVLHAPTCITCHSAHGIHPAAAPHSPTSRLRVAGETCARCHGSVRIAEMHDLPVKVVEDFRGSFHRLAGARGDRRVANCASCHGVHEIRPSSNPFSRTHPTNLARTCGECHPGAAGLFARGGIHHTTTTFGHRLVEIVGGMYGGMIAVVIGLMAIHNGLDFQRRWRDRRRSTDPAQASEYLRFTLNERIQHWLLAVSFVTLAATGFALRFAWPVPLIGGEMQESLRAGIHRGAAVLFGGLGLYHIGYLALTARGRSVARSILPCLRSATDAVYCIAACARLGPPTLADWRELLATLRYNVGLTRERPRYGRFTYWEKMEYWALVWGAVVMISTGLVLWFEVPVLNRVPYWAYELVRTIHFYEATLAVLAIVVWHLYYVVINPDVFPLNRAMTRGTLTVAEMQREHPLDLGRSNSHEMDGTSRCVHGVGDDARCRVCHPDASVESGAGSAPGGGQAFHGEAGHGGGPPQADGGHQGP